MTDQISIVLILNARKAFVEMFLIIFYLRGRQTVTEQENDCIFTKIRKKLSKIFMNFGMVIYEEKYTITSV